MKIEISTATYEAIAAVTPDVSAFVERAAQRELTESKAAPNGQPLAERFRKYRGMLQGVSIEDLVESRHAGLS